MNTAVLNGSVLNGPLSAPPAAPVPPDLLAALKAAHDAEPPTAIPLNAVRVGLDRTQPYAEIRERTTVELLRTSTDDFERVTLALRVYAATVAAASDPAEALAEWLDERVVRFTTAGRPAVAGPFHRGEPRPIALIGRGRDGPQFVVEHLFKGDVVRGRKEPTT